MEATPPLVPPFSFLCPPHWKWYKFHSKIVEILPDFRPHSCRRGATTNLTSWAKLCQFKLKCFKARFIDLFAILTWANYNLRNEFIYSNLIYDSLISVNLTGACWIATHLFVSLQHMCECSCCTICGADGIISRDTKNTLEQKQNSGQMAKLLGGVQFENNPVCRLN